MICVRPATTQAEERHERAMTFRTEKQANRPVWNKVFARYRETQ